MKRIFLSILSVLMCTSMLFGCISIATSDAPTPSEYDAAMALIDEGKYEEAYEALLKLEDDENAKKAMEQLDNLKGCEMHTTVILSEADERVLKKLQINLTSEPKREGSRLYHK